MQLIMKTKNILSIFLPYFKVNWIQNFLDFGFVLRVTEIHQCLDYKAAIVVQFMFWKLYVELFRKPIKNLIR